MVSPGELPEPPKRPVRSERQGLGAGRDLYAWDDMALENRAPNLPSGKLT